MYIFYANRQMFSFSVFYRKRQFIKLVRTYKRNVFFLYLRMISWKQVRTKPLYICKYPPLPYDKKSIFMKYPVPGVPH